MRPPTPAGRIRRLRRRIALLFTLTSAVALIGMAALAVHADDTSWRGQVDADLTARVREAVAELRTGDDGALLYPDPKEGGYDCPAVTLLTGPPDRLTVAARAHRPCVTAAPAAVNAVAQAAAVAPDSARATSYDQGGHQVRLFAQSFLAPPDEDVPTGVVVAATDVSAPQSAHDRLTLEITAACAALIVLSALSGRLLAGRAVRPALTALDQQEAFLADAAHDLRTPAASLRLLAETGLRGEADPTEVLRRTLRLSTRMGELVDGLLTRARLMAAAVDLDLQPLRLDQLVDAVVTDVPADGHHVSTRTEPVIVRADPELLRRAVANLLGNALAHGHAPGEAADVEVTVSADGKVAVDDAGPGVPPEQAHSLFERFRSGAGSSGLGLSIAAWVAHAHGGSLTVTAGERGGARFVLSVPVHQRP
ncbi:HAMP domain-containing sensor histidine kinase [Streptomyces sp. RerS4]|uniref:sensor histidine kinase n=1 Tax=Streptomyces sp. RerS4 TaxID=2942449 RepID=UPI00201C2406|nr:HAMP domain-containing sensor histidine kinase [Streptomyces sp. RerS4]UQX03029.1 HAMP domain-containing histidine kinase [Streptomyces sp. RerS4]